MKGAWAVVTGASSGIGKEIARELAKREINLILVARRLGLLEELASELKVETRCIQADLSNPDSCRKLFEDCTRHTDVQILVNNAGMGDYGDFVKTPLEKHLTMINLNITAVTVLSHLFANHMQGHLKRSHILNVASIGAFQTVPKLGAYCGTKKYVKDLSETMDFELDGGNIAVSCISPGGTYTEFMQNANQVMKKGSEKYMMSAPAVGKIAVNGMLKSKRQIVPGFINWLTTIFAKIVPDRFQLAINNYFFTNEN